MLPHAQNSKNPNSGEQSRRNFLRTRQSASQIATADTLDGLSVFFVGVNFSYIIHCQFIGAAN